MIQRTKAKVMGAPTPMAGLALGSLRAWVGVGKTSPNYMAMDSGLAQVLQVYC